MKKLSDIALTKKLYSNKKLSNCSIEIINSCIFKCDHCYMPNNRVNKMTFEVYKKIIDELYDEGCLKVLITGGEPLLHPEFKAFYIYAKEKGFIVSINTNAFLLNEEILELFLKYKPYVVEISLYGYDNISYENYVHVKNAFDICNRNINMLLEKNININLKSVLTKNNVGYIDKLKSYAHQKGVEFRYDYIVFPKINCILGKGNPERLTVNRTIETLLNDDEAVKHFKSKVLENSKNSSNYVFECFGGEDAIYIDSYGNINICVSIMNDKFNINDYKIIDVINEFIKFKKIKYSKNSKCKDCKNKNLCRYCPGRFYLETGDYQKPAMWYCDMQEALNKEFRDKYLFDANNKLSDAYLLDMFNIITANMKIMDVDFKINDNDFDVWKNNILNSNLVTYVSKNEKINGYIQFLKEEKYICEIQIDYKYQGDKKTFRELMNMFIKIANIKINDRVFLNINPSNEKSKLVFTKIGFENKSVNRYEILGKDLIKWSKNTL